MTAPTPRRRVVVALSALVLFVLGLVVVAIGVSVTQTAWGRDQIRRIVLARLRSAIHGKLYIGRLNGNLFSNLEIDSVELRDPEGRLFLATGHLSVAFDPRDLVDQRILLQHIEVEHPVVRIVKYRKTGWNYREIFPGSATPKRKLPHVRGFGDYIVAENATVHDASIEYSEPWQPDDSLRGSRRDAAIAAELAKPDGAVRRWGYEDGLMHTFSWHHSSLKAHYVRIAEPDTSGLYFGVDTVSTDESEPKFKFRNIRGIAQVKGDSLWLNFPHFELPGSSGRAAGKLVFGNGQPVRISLHAVADTASLSDIAWVYPTLPTTGGGSATIDIKSHGDPHYIDYALSKMDVSTTGSRFHGAMTFTVGGPYLAVRNMAIKATPLDFAFIRQLGGKPFPVDYEGKFTGTVNARGGPLNDFYADSIRMSFADDHVPGAVSQFAGHGLLDIHDPQITRFHAFYLNLGRLDLRTLQFLYKDFPLLHGIVTGHATLDSLWDDIRLRDADLTQIDGPDEPTRVTGGGRVTFGDSLVTYDLAVQFARLSFATLMRSYAGAWFRGSFTGPLRMKGTLDNLDLSADLTSDAGEVSTNGHFNLLGPTFEARGTTTLTDVDLPVIFGRPDLVSTDLTVTAQGNLVGDTLADMRGVLRVSMAKSQIDSVEADTGHVTLTFGDGAVQIDSLHAQTAIAALNAQGALGLVSGHHDSTGFSVAFDSLGALRRYVPGDTVHGTAQVTGILAGWLDSLTARGRIDATDLRYGRDRVHGAQATFDVAGLPRNASGTVALAFDTLRLSGVALEEVSGEARVARGKETHATIHAVSANGPTADAGGSIVLHGDTTDMVLDSLALRTPGNDWHLDHPAHVRNDPSGLTLDSVVARGAVAGWIAAKAHVPRTGTLAIHASGDSIPLADLSALAQSLDQAGGWAGFDLNIANTSASPIMRFTAHLNDAKLGEVGIDEIRTDGHYRNHQLDLHTDFVQRGDTAIHVAVVLPVDLALENVPRRALDDPLRGELRSDSAKLSTILGVLPDVTNPSGWFTAHINLGGTWRHPTFDGQVRVANGSLGLSNIGVRWDSVNTMLDLEGDSLALSHLSLTTEANDRRGTASLGGWVTFADPDNPRFDIWLRAEHFHAIDRLRLANLTLSTKTGRGTVDTLRLEGSERSSVLTGRVVVDQGSIFLPDFNKKQIVNLDDPELYNLVDTSLFANRRLLPNGPPLLVSGLNLDNVSIDLGTDTWLKSTEANINLSGTVDVTTARLPRDTTKALALTGSVSATRGSYVLNLGLVQRTFTVEQPGTITFSGEPEFNPSLDITAVNIVHPSGQTQQYVKPEIRVQVHLGGTLDHLQLGLFSQDSLPQSDLISYLVSGVPSYELNQANSGALATSIVLPTIGSAVGSRLTGGVFDTFEVQTFGGYQQGRVATSSAFSQARIGAGKQVGPDTFISADYGFCSGIGGQGANPGYQLGVRVDQRLTRQLSLSAASSPGTTYAYCTGSGSGGYSGFIPTPRQYGLDLFRTWSF